MELYREYAHSAIPRLETQEITAEDLVLSCFQRIEAVDAKIKAYITTYKDEALKTAKEVDKQRKSGKKLGALADRKSVV